VCGGSLVAHHTPPDLLVRAFRFEPLTGGGAHHETRRRNSSRSPIPLQHESPNTARTGQWFSLLSRDRESTHEKALFFRGRCPLTTPLLYDHTFHSGRFHPSLSCICALVSRQDNLALVEIQLEGSQAHQTIVLPSLRCSRRSSRNRLPDPKPSMPCSQSLWRGRSGIPQRDRRPRFLPDPPNRPGRRQTFQRRFGCQLPSPIPS